MPSFCFQAPIPNSSPCQHLPITFILQGGCLDQKGGPPAFSWRGFARTRHPVDYRHAGIEHARYQPIPSIVRMSFRFIALLSQMDDIGRAGLPSGQHRIQKTPG
jgi:hypothetical protein